MSTATKNIWLWTNFKSPQPKKFVTSKVKKWLWKEKTRKWLWNLYGPVRMGVVTGRNVTTSANSSQMLYPLYHWLKQKYKQILH